MSKVVGIDLGTTNSVVAVLEGDSPTVIPNSEGGRTTPSVVAFTKEGERLVGQVAKRQAVTNPENTIYSIKRFMGRKFSEVAEEVKMVPYKVVEGPNGDVRIEVRGKLYSPPEISAMILQKLKQSAEDYLGEKVTKAVITVPAYFNDSQRQATKDAGKIAGLDVQRIVNEPTAAALAYGLDKKKDETIAVYDFGGGTFDISALEVGEGVVEVKATNGDTHLGGDNFDQRIIDWIVAEFKKDQGIDLSKDKMAIQRLREAAEKAKIELSSTVETEINLPFVTADASGPKHLSLKLSRAKLEQLVGDLIDKSIGPVQQCLKDASVEAKDIDEVVLVGGMTRMPKIQDTVQKFFGKGVMTKLIERNTTIPTRKGEVFSTAEDNQPSVEIHVLQGEREMARDNRTLGKFHLVGIPPAPRGVPQVEVTFDIDANGILNVSAKDRATGKTQNITITSSSGLNKEEVEKMVREAQAHSEEDKKRREMVDLRNQADSLAYNLEKLLSDNKDKIDSAQAKEIEDAVAETRKAMEGEDADALKKAVERVTSLSHRVAEALYKASGAQPGEGGGPSGPAGSGGPSGAAGGKPADDVVDAEYTVKE